MKTTAPHLSLLALLVLPGLTLSVAQDTAPATDAVAAAPAADAAASETASQPDEATQTSASLVEAYVAAFNRGDAKAVAAFYTEDARYSSDTGDSMVGRDKVAASLTKFFAANPGAVLNTEVIEARFLTPEVLLEKGFATVATADAADTETTRYSATYVKKDGSWLISDLDETVLPPANEAAQALAGLDWMVGTWKDENTGAKVETRIAWTLNKRFLRRSFSIAQENADPLEGTEVIGYDVAAGTLRSWTFDSEGGFAESVWRQENNKWLVLVSSTLEDGSRFTAQNIITSVADGKFTFESINRFLDGEALPNMDRITVVRTATE